MYRVDQESETTNLWPQFYQMLADFHFFHWKFGVNWLSTIRQLLVYAVKLHINIRQQAINDNLQGCVGTYQGVVGLLITKLRKVY